MRIELQHLSKQFGRTRALRDIVLTIAEGSRVALLGPNGSGKSTLLRAVMGLIDCEGAVLLDGRSPFAKRHEIAAQLAYVPQSAPQWGATVNDIVRTVCSLRDIPRDRVDVLAGRLGLDTTALRSRPFRDLSGGMKHKLLIATALATDASLFILDEPTASLDAASRALFFQLLEERAPKATQVFCSHRFEEIRSRADRLIVLGEGAIVFDGPVSEYEDYEVVGPRNGGGSTAHAGGLAAPMRVAPHDLALVRSYR